MVFQFMTIADFLSMGGHGAYVWASYGITVLALLLVAIIPRWQQPQLLLQFKRQQRLQKQSTAVKNR